MAVGLKEAASISSLELTLTAILDGSCTEDYILGLVSMETQGKSTVEKVNRTIRRMTVNSKLLPYIQAHPDEFMANIHSGSNRCAIYSAIMCAAYPVFYDIVSISGKFFHAQEELPATLLFSKLREKYGSSVNCQKGFSCATRMLAAAGIIERPRLGVYKAGRMTNLSDFSMSLYKKAFMLNNSNYSDSDDVTTHPFFEFIH